MAYKDRLKISIQNASGDYYTATLQDDNTYDVDTEVSVKYLKHLPIGWEDTPLKFTRNMDYAGVFRTHSESMQFTADGRAILLDLMYGGGGVNAYALVTVYKLNEATHGYDVFFSAEVDFSSLEDDKQKMILSTPLLESHAVEMLKAKSNSSFNIPFWVYDEGEEGWVPNDTEYLEMNPVKLLWRRDFIGAETEATPLLYEIRGWNDGEHGTGSDEGQHTLPYLANFTKVQNNGSTTYVGNDILSEYTDNSEQVGAYGEVNFLDVGNSFQTGRYIFKTSLTGQKMNFTLSGKFDGDITVGFGGGSDYILAFVLFEINPNGEPPQSTPGFYDFYQSIYQLTLPSGITTPADDGVFSVTTLIDFNPNKAYCLGIIFDGDGFPVPSGPPLNPFCQFALSDLQVVIESNYVSGTDTPVIAPALPETYVPSFNAYTLWQKLIRSIDSITTDVYGFPVIVGDFSGTSTYLSSSNDPADNYGLASNLLNFTSENALRNINGIQYLTTSVAEFFKTFRNIDGCGLGIEGSSIRIEKLEYFFDSSTEILPLGDTVQGLKITPMSQQMFNNIKAGYKEPSTNNLFGVDEYIIPTEYVTPSNKTPKVEDMSVTSPIAGQYEIEKMRAQVPLNTVSSPSAANAMVILQRTDTEADEQAVLSPDGTETLVTPYELLIFPTAQSTDPTAASDPYINGMYYPETARNIGLQPARNMFRNGSYLRSILDQMDSEYLTYRKQYQMNYNNPVDPLEQPGISTKVYGTAANAVADIAISDLDSQLFRPYMFEVEVAYPESMFASIASNPYGYISLTWKGEELKGFIYEVTQNAGNNSPTRMSLIAHPDTTDAQLKL